MLRSLRHLYGSKLGASDGEIGDVKDFYFDDQNWAVRYVVADTGTWLPGRKVLIPPHAFGKLQETGKLLLVNLTRQQIENSPPIELHKPVSRQYEEDYFRYFGWPGYWEGERADAHLRSTQAVNGYHLQASDGIFGHLCDYLIDDQDWTIRQLVIKTGHRLTGPEVQIPVSQVDRLSYEKSTVFVNLTGAAVEQSPPYHLTLADAAA